MIKKMSILILILVITIVCLVFASADPEPPVAVTKQTSTRHNTSGSILTSSFGAPAQAGNVTYINITAEANTKTWMAYYGNVTGTIKLENLQGNAIYSWSLTAPGGKIFATENTVSSWDSVYCWNWSKATGNGLRFSEWNNDFNSTGGAVDGVNETFNASYSYTPFYITGRLFSNVAGTEDGGRAGVCPAIELFNNSGGKSGQNQYEEVILGRVAVTATTNFYTDDLIYMATLEPGKLGFNGEQVDFQLIVPDDGHNTQALVVTNYYFYIELEAS